MEGDVDRHADVVTVTNDTCRTATEDVVQKATSSDREALVGRGENPAPANVREEREGKHAVSVEAVVDEQRAP